MLGEAHECIRAEHATDAKHHRERPAPRGRWGLHWLRGRLLPAATKRLHMKFSGEQPVHRRGTLDGAQLVPGPATVLQPALSHRQPVRVMHHHANEQEDPCVLHLGRGETSLPA